MQPESTKFKRNEIRRTRLMEQLAHVKEARLRARPHRFATETTSKTNGSLQKAQVITLQRDAARTAYVRDSLLPQLRTVIPDSQMFEAIDGHSESIANTISQAGLTVNEASRLSKGMVGCFMSHFSIWKQWAEQNNPQTTNLDDWLLVLEDDVTMTHHAVLSFERRLQRLVEEGNNSGSHFIYLWTPESSSAHEIPLLRRLSSPLYTLVAYVLTRRAAAILVEELRRRPTIDRAVDAFLTEFLHSTNPFPVHYLSSSTYLFDTIGQRTEQYQGERFTSNLWNDAPFLSNS